MSLFWKPEQHSNQENGIWANLRAMEWGSFPSFVSQPIAPILMLFFNPIVVVLVIIILNILWRFVRYKTYNPYLSSLAVYFVKLKWISVVGMAILFYLNHNIPYALVSLFWVPISYVLMVSSMPVEVGRIEKNILKMMGLL